MTEEEAKAWLAALGVSRETLLRLEAYRDLVVGETARHNLVSASSIPHFWARHIVDSAQLLPLAHAAPSGPWLDLGSGAGMPGLVIAMLDPRPVVLVEERRLRANFLERVKASLGLDHVSVIGQRIERVAPFGAAVISARAFAPLEKLLGLAQAFAQKNTLWLLPKGRTAAEELAKTRGAWQGVFHVEPSVTSDDASIIVATGVAPVAKGKRRQR